MKVHTFGEKVLVGDEGEKIIIDWLLGLKNIEKVDDLSKIEKYQNMGLDVKVTYKDGEETTAEIKTDLRSLDTGNVAFETISDEAKNKIGWFLSTEAKWLLHFCYNEDILYKAPMDKIRSWFLENKHLTKDLEKCHFDKPAKNPTYMSWVHPISKKELETLPFVKTYKGIKEKANAKS
tara:strand:+ start:138 stop:671 length:534 start_codon:yes stop_codon:yes gene_type:complete